VGKGHFTSLLPFPTKPILTKPYLTYGPGGIFNIFFTPWLSTFWTLTLKRSNCCGNESALFRRSFIPKEHDIYCAKCYEDKFATKCIKCNKVSFTCHMCPFSFPIGISETVPPPFGQQDSTLSTRNCTCVPNPYCSLLNVPSERHLCKNATFISYKSLSGKHAAVTTLSALLAKILHVTFVVATPFPNSAVTL
jgi:hypothetical protein